MAPELLDVLKDIVVDENGRAMLARSGQHKASGSIPEVSEVECIPEIGGVHPVDDLELDSLISR